MGAVESYLRVARSYPIVRAWHRRASPLTDRPKLLLARPRERLQPIRPLGNAHRSDHNQDR